MTTRERIRAAIRENPNQMTILLARQFEVPEAEVIRAFPDDRAVEKPGHIEGQEAKLKAFGGHGSDCARKMATSESSFGSPLALNSASNAARPVTWKAQPSWVGSPPFSASPISTW